MIKKKKKFNWDYNQADFNQILTNRNSKLIRYWNLNSEKLALPIKAFILKEGYLMQISFYKV